MRGNDCDYVHTYDLSTINQVVANISSELNSDEKSNGASTPEKATTAKPTFSLNEFPTLSPVYINNNNNNNTKGSKKKVKII